LPPLLVIASRNQGKLAEIRALLAPWQIEAQSALSLGFDAEIEETGATFMENACLKARALAAALRLPALADDSGLMVEALEGRPGVFSARYAGNQANEAENNRKLLRDMTGQTNRKASFACAMVCARPDGMTIQAQGFLGGEIALSLRGTGGFGYDPLFFLPELGQTLAQLSPEQKNCLSHRGKALRRIMTRLPGFLHGSS
jgi:XTP/dITP diphosphohydrolase